MVVAWLQIRVGHPVCVPNFLVGWIESLFHAPCCVLARLRFRNDPQLGMYSGLRWDTQTNSPEAHIRALGGDYEV